MSYYLAGMPGGIALGVAWCFAAGLPNRRTRLAAAGTAAAGWSAIALLHWSGAAATFAACFAGVMLGVAAGFVLFLLWEAGHGGGGDDATATPEPGPDGGLALPVPSRGRHDLMADLLATPAGPIEPVITPVGPLVRILRRLH